MEEFILNHDPLPSGPSALLAPAAAAIPLSLAPYQTALAAAPAVEARTVSARPRAFRRIHNLSLLRLCQRIESEARPAMFLTWTLQDSLPPNRAFSDGTDLVWQDFTTVDQLLGEARSGPLYLRQREIATMVARTIVAFGAVEHLYDLHSYVVMSNHVHLLLTPRTALPKLTAALQTATAQRANDMLGQPGAAFWGASRCDYRVSNPYEFGRVSKYIESNPVPVGLARDAAAFPYSSATRDSCAAHSDRAFAQSA